MRCSLCCCTFYVPNFKNHSNLLPLQKILFLVLHFLILIFYFSLFLHLLQICILSERQIWFLLYYFCASFELINFKLIFESLLLFLLLFLPRLYTFICAMNLMVSICSVSFHGSKIILRKTFSLWHCNSNFYKGDNSVDLKVLSFFSIFSVTKFVPFEHLMELFV